MRTHQTYMPQHYFGARRAGVNTRKFVKSGEGTKVAAHVHAETIPEAISPGLTLREALVNSSEFFGEKAVYRAWIAVRHIMKALKNKPIPRKIFREDGRLRTTPTYRPLTRKSKHTVEHGMDLWLTDAITSSLRKYGFGHVGIRYVEVDSDHEFVPSLRVRKKTEVFEATELPLL